MHTRGTLLREWCSIRSTSESSRGGGGQRVNNVDTTRMGASTSTAGTEATSRGQGRLGVCNDGTGRGTGLARQAGAPGGGQGGVVRGRGRGRAGLRQRQPAAAPKHMSRRCRVVEGEQAGGGGTQKRNMRPIWERSWSSGMWGMRGLCAMTKLSSDELNQEKMIFSGGDGKRLEVIPTIVKGLIPFIICSGRSKYFSKKLQIFPGKFSTRGETTVDRVHFCWEYLRFSPKTRRIFFAGYPVRWHLVLQKLRHHYLRTTSIFELSFLEALHEGSLFFFAANSMMLRTGSIANIIGDSGSPCLSSLGHG